MYKYYDSKIQFTFKKELYSCIKSYGYDNVSEYVLIEYYSNKTSFKKIAKNLNKSLCSVLYWMKKWDYKERNKTWTLK